MKHKYIPKGKGKVKGSPGTGRYVNPDCWITGPDLEVRNKYYAYLKHRAQCRYRKEDYSLTFDDWNTLWPDHLWKQRGRGVDAMCLNRVHYQFGWHLENCIVTTRREHLKRRKDYDVRS